MKNLKIALALAAIIGLTTFTVGIALANITNTPSTSAVPQAQTEDWWNQMQEYMQARWNGIGDQEWFNNMTQYMEQHWNDVQNQTWFNPMLQYMQEQGYQVSNNQPYGYQPYGSEPYCYGDDYGNYYAPNYGRGFGCRGW
jgi:hypothetical protein